MDVDVIIVGGGVGGATLATVLAKKGRKVLVIEREAKFRDRVRGENMLPWGVAVARRLGVLDDLVAAGAHTAAFFNTYVMGVQTNHRPLRETTPGGEGSLNMYHPDIQETLLAGAVKAGAEVKRGCNVQGIAAQDGKYTVAYSENGQSHALSARLVVGADGRFSKMRDWGGFTVERDPELLRIAGTVMQGTNIPDDGTHFSIGPGIGTFIAPLGKKRARVYVIYAGAMGDRKLSGPAKIADFLAA